MRSANPIKHVNSGCDCHNGAKAVVIWIAKQEYNATHFNICSANDVTVPLAFWQRINCNPEYLSHRMTMSEGAVDRQLIYVEESRTQREARKALRRYTKRQKAMDKPSPDYRNISVVSTRVQSEPFKPPFGYAGPRLTNPDFRTPNNTPSEQEPEENGYVSAEMLSMTE